MSAGANYRPLIIIGAWRVFERDIFEAVLLGVASV